MDEYETMVEEEKIYKAKLFQYPDWQNPSAIFDYEDIENDENKVYVWHGSYNEVSPEEI